jgi:hypothetical protein
VIDAVTYSDGDPWPTTTDGTGPSLELMDPLADNNDPANWAASTASSGSTPGAVNSVATTGVRPHISAVAATPTVPTANQAVTVTATITGQTGPVVRSQTDFGAQLTTPMTPTGGTSYSATIPGAAVEMPQNHELTLAGLVEPVDEFAMNADWSDNSHGRPTLAWDSYATVGVVNEQVMQLRVQKNSAFHGLYTYLDLFDRTWRDREGYSDKQFFRAGQGAFDETRQLVELRWEKKNPEDEDFTTISPFLAGSPPTWSGRSSPARTAVPARRHYLDDQPLSARPPREVSPRPAAGRPARER